METKIEKLEFVQYHKPPLTAGAYTIKVTQKVKDKKNKINWSSGSKSPEQHFQVRGNRFTVSPNDIHSVYPSPGSFGDYDLVLPHIVLNRSTLPWEREPDLNQGPKSGASWLALLLFDESETPEIEVVTLNKLKGITLEPGQNGTDKISIIKIKKSLLTQIAPAYADLEYLSHIRLSKDNSGNVIGGEKATILCNRMPKEGQASTLHLVSIEGRYENDSPNFGTTSDITLVSLHSWSFTCTGKKGSYEEILKDLDVEVLRLPKNNNQETEIFIKKGFVPLRHEMRKGQKTVSWYHGPLAPVEIDWPTLPLPAQSADELLHYNKSTGLFDVSYAAAWEHGRMLALQDPKFSMALFHWKKELVSGQIKSQQLANWEYLMPTGSLKNPEEDLLAKAADILFHGHLSEEQDYEKYGIPKIVEEFFDDLRLLKGVSFDYLVANENMLPAESIRFFKVDPVWMDCLLDGAYSLGEDSERSTSSTISEEAHHHEKKMTGFLLRSDVVRGWPGLLINAYNENLDGKDEDYTKGKTPLKILRKELLSKEVLFVLYEGDILTLDFFLAPDTLHFGLDKDDDDVDGPGDSNDSNTGKFWQVLRNEDGIEQNEKVDMQIKDVPFRGNTEMLVIDIKTLATNIEDKLNENNQLTLSKEETFCSAHFALQMIEGVEKVRFLRK